MTKMRLRTAGVALASAALLLTGVSAGRAEPAAGPEAFQILRLSAELARAGRDRRDPWALATAARLRRETPLQFVAREGADSPDNAWDASDAWLDEAMALGGSDPRLASFVEDVRAITFKGRQGGPKVSTARLGAGLSHRFGESFEAGRPAVVFLEGDGDTDLSLSVKGPNGQTACSDSSPGDVKLCAWTPERRGGYAVEVLNRGRVANRYALATN